MSDESPWEFVQRRRREGAQDEPLRQELLARGVDVADVQLLLSREAAEPVTPRVTMPSGTAESAWSVLQRMRAEGFSQPQIEAELASQGHDREDIAALFADDPMRVAPGRRAPDPTAATVDVVAIVFGLLLLSAGLLVLLSGRISVLSFMLIVSGITRIANAARAQPGVLPEASLAHNLRPLADEDPRARCQRHPSFASIGTCPRCGTFCCARCVTKPGLRADQPCLACQRLPAFVEDRLRMLCRSLAPRLLVAPAVLLLLALDFHLPLGPDWIAVLFLVAPWLMLAVFQRLSSRLWPTWTSVGVWIATTLIFLFVFVSLRRAPTLQWLPWFLGVWPAIAARRAVGKLVEPPAPLIPDEELVPDR